MAGLSTAISAGALSFSSFAMRSASFGPTPGALRSALLSFSAMARDTPSGPKRPRMASDAFAPTPCTEVSTRCHSFSSRLGKP